jgi:hypothetical protein
MQNKKFFLGATFILLTITMLGSGIQVQAVDKPANFFTVHLIAPTSNPVRDQLGSPRAPCN